MKKCPINTESPNPINIGSAQILSQGGGLQAVMNTVLDGLIIIDEYAVVQAFNPAAERIFGYVSHEVVGKNVKMLMPDPYKSEHDGYIKNYKQTHDAKVIGIGREVSGQRKNGEIFPMELGVNEMNLKDVRLFVGTVRDISVRKASEIKISEYIDALQRSNQELDAFAYIASHDLKEPLRGLSNNAVFLKEDHGESLPDDGIKRIDRIIFLSERMESLVNDLLHFSRIGKQELAVDKIDLNDIIHEISGMMELRFSDTNVNIIMPRPLPAITCDRVRLTEALRNLINNAIKYNDKSEIKIEIGYVDPDPQLPHVHTFYVKDNGIGIPSQYHAEIFRIFKRLNEEKDTVKGTGVGLTFVKKIIERHGGKIWLESEEGQGTTFFFEINEGVIK